VQPNAPPLASESRSWRRHTAHAQRGNHEPLSYSAMKVVILCGGKGTRLREETEYRPKPKRPTHHALVRMCATRNWHVRYLDRQNEPWDVLGTLLHSIGAAPNQGHIAFNALARTVWRALKFLALSAARSRSVRRILPLSGNVPMGTIIAAQKPIAAASTPKPADQPLQTPY
jgi:hypothetical protein